MKGTSGTWGGFGMIEIQAEVWNLTILIYRGDWYWSEPLLVVYVTSKHFRSTMFQIHFNNLSSPFNQKTSSIMSTSEIVTKLTLSFTVRHDEASRVHTLLKSVLSDALELTIQIVSLRRIKEGRAVSFPFCNYSVSAHTTLLMKSNRRWKSFRCRNNVASARMKLFVELYPIFICKRRVENKLSLISFL